MKAPRWLPTVVLAAFCQACAWGGWSSRPRAPVSPQSAAAAVPEAQPLSAADWLAGGLTPERLAAATIGELRAAWLLLASQPGDARHAVDLVLREIYRRDPWAAMDGGGSGGG